jgi:hypothetical protein
MMIRTLLEFLIERSLDEGRQPPGWLRWLARHDCRLHDHSQHALALDRALRSGAVSRRHELAGDTQVVPMTDPVFVERSPARSDSSVTRWGWLAATAAALMGVAAFVNHNNEQQARAAHAQLVSKQLTKVPDEMLAVIADVARTPREFSPLTRVSLPDVNPWSDIPRGTQGQLKQSFSAWGSQLSDLGERVYQRFDLRSEAEMN